MGQKGSKVRGILRKSPASSGSSPLNNATYWEAEEDPEWDNCVMVVANQRGRQQHQQNQQRLGGSNDSLARSLHKDVDYPAINVSRRSPDQRDVSSLAPESRYPTPNPGTINTGPRKRQNTLLDTGWHTCFKNNNYVFVRNGSGTRPERQYGDKVKDTNSDITFVIATTDPEKQEHGEKLIVSLQDPVPKIQKCSPITPQERLAVTTPSVSAKSASDSKSEHSSGKKQKRSDKKKSSWLKKLTPGRNKVKVDATIEETAPIYESSSEESPESKENRPITCSPAKKVIRITPSTVETPVKAIDLIGEGPHTSTPKFIQDNDRVYKSLPRGGHKPTPHRPYDGRYSVRRRLPYGETPERDESLFQVSPVSTGSSGMRPRSKPNLDLSPLERRASCHRKIIESPKFQNRLHPTESMTDIPYADSVDEISYDDSPKPKISKGNNSSEPTETKAFGERQNTRVSQGNSTDFSGNVFFDESPKTKVSRENSSDISEKVSFDERPKTKVSRGNSTDSENVFFEEKPKVKVSRGISADFSEIVAIDERPKTKVSRGSQADLSDVSFDERPKTVSRGSQSDLYEEVSFDERPRRRIFRTKTFDGSQDVSTYNGLPRRRITRANTVVMRPKQRERCFSEPSDERTLGSLPEMRPYADDSVDERSFSEPSLRVKRSMSCRIIQNDASPMEEEENRSLEWHAKELRSPDDSTVTFSPYAPKKSPERENPVSTWLKELRILTESECLNALQAKEIIKEDWIANALAVGNAQEKAEMIWDAGSAVSKHVEEMLDSLKKPKMSSTPFSLKVAQFCSSVVELLKMGSPAEQQISQVEARIKKSCAELLDALNRDEDVEGWKNKMVTELQAVQESLKVIVKKLLFKQLQVIAECVDRAANLNSLKRSVFALILLGRLDPTFCDIAVKLGAVRSLLAIVVESKWKEMHPCALRALTVLSCVPTAIRSFEESGGVDCVCDVLCEAATSEGSRSEAAGLVAQITAPWTEGSGYVLQSINQNAQRLVRSIACLAEKTESSEVFLLSSAALANLSFADDVLGKMKESRVLEILVGASRNSAHAASLFIKDQVATVLANMASKEDYRSELCSGGGLVLLLCFLQLRPSVGHGAPQLAACERIQQKAAIALARLCTDPQTSNTVADMQGIQRLVKLCKDRKERNDSDSVLVACLAALRKIAAVRQKDEFKKLGAQELVESRLWDAFLAHSSKRESYV